MVKNWKEIQIFFSNFEETEKMLEKITENFEDTVEKSGGN